MQKFKKEVNKYMRKFEEVKHNKMKFPDLTTKIPRRADSRSAGYDFYSKEHFVLMPGEEKLTWTDVKARMFFDNVLFIYTRSGNGCKHGIILKNNTGVIDPSYYSNPDNDGNIGICLVNSGNEPFEVNVGDRIAQGVFTRYLITDDDDCFSYSESNGRTGGFGSSGK